MSGTHIQILRNIYKSGLPFVFVGQARSSFHNPSQDLNRHDLPLISLPMMPGGLLIQQTI